MEEEKKPRMLAIIGTAGRDAAKPFTVDLWNAMCAHAAEHVKTHGIEHLVSGGAAWADHLAVHLFLNGLVKSLRLHLPAPITRDRFAGPYRSAGSAATYYHERFSAVIGRPSIAEIVRCATLPSYSDSVQQPAMGYHAMFARNKLVAADSAAMLAYTWGLDSQPDDGGTRNTWDQCQAHEKWHVSLTTLA